MARIFGYDSLLQMLRGGRSTDLYAGSAHCARINQEPEHAVSSRTFQRTPRRQPDLDRRERPQLRDAIRGGRYSTRAW